MRRAHTHTHRACLCGSVEFMSQIRDGRVNSSADSPLIECSFASAALCLPNDKVELALCVYMCVCVSVCVRVCARASNVHMGVFAASAVPQPGHIFNAQCARINRKPEQPRLANTITILTTYFI